MLEAMKKCKDPDKIKKFWAKSTQPPTANGQTKNQWKSTLCDGGVVTPKMIFIIIIIIRLYLNLNFLHALILYFINRTFIKAYIYYRTSMK